MSCAGKNTLSIYKIYYFTHQIFENTDMERIFFSGYSFQGFLFTVERWRQYRTGHSWSLGGVKDDIYTLLNVALALCQPKHRPRFAISIPKHWAYLQWRTNKWKKNSLDVVVKLQRLRGQGKLHPLNGLGHEIEFKFFSKWIVVGQYKKLY
jgi:hypothetical protein